MTKSIPPSSLTQRSTACCKLSSWRTSTEPIPITLAPGRAVAMSWATRSVFSTLRPMMQALAPRCTKARTWALQIVPAPPVQKTTLFAGQEVSVTECWQWTMELTEDPILPGVTQIFCLGERHSDYYVLPWRYLFKDCGGFGDVQEVTVWMIPASPQLDLGSLVLYIFIHFMCSEFR